MLKIITYENREQINQIFENHDPRSETWVVSDLRTKFELQKKILQRDGYFIDESILRASDLWKILLKRVEPNLRLVSESFAKSVLHSLIEDKKEVLQINSTAVESIYSYIDQLAPIIFHPEGRAQLIEWFDKYPDSNNRWRDWFNRAFICSQILLKEHRIITAQWITSHLQQINEVEKYWSTPLVVDLGGELTRAEAEILRLLAKKVDVTLLEPRPKWRDEFSFLLQSYSDLHAQGVEKKAPDISHSSGKRVQVLRLSGMLSEIKNTVGQIREWIEEGVSTENIAVIAPDIEIYWPVLEAFFAQEGIPVNKDVKGKLQSLPAVTQWLAELRSATERVSSSDLEIAFFMGPHSQKLRYEDFRALYLSLYSAEDLVRNEMVRRVFEKRIDLRGLIKRDEFVAQALIFWSSHEKEDVQIVLREVLQNATGSTQMYWKNWLSYLETIVATKEFNINKGNSQGVAVTKLMSAHSDKYSHRIFIGLAEEAFRKPSRTQLSGRDIFNLGKDLGFYLINPDQTDLEFELRMLSEQDAKFDIFTFGAANLEGDILGPSKFWMKIAKEPEIVHPPKETRWDQLQKVRFRGGRPWTQGYDNLLELRVEQDLGESPLEKLKIAELPSLSVTSIEKFLKCPFIFSAEKYFKLADPPEVDLDVDRRTRGRLAHALFEVLTKEPMRFDYSENELADILEKIRSEKEIILADERLWSPLKKRHIRLGLRFLDFEKKWRKEFTSTKTLAGEKGFEFYWHPESGRFDQQPIEGAFRISGQVDRIDGDEKGNLVVIDYKSSGNKLSSHTAWLEKRELQLLFYMWVIEKGLFEELNGRVVGVFYYIFKDFQRKGFRLNDLVGTLYPPPPKKDVETNELKEEYLNSFFELITETIKKIGLGEYEAKPMEFDTCNRCNWRRQCRAPHLN